MRIPYLLSLSACLGLGLWLGGRAADQNPAPDAEEGVVNTTAVLQADDLPEPQPGVQPLGRGPVHEAYATPGSAAVPKPGPLIPKEPPEPIEELPPAQKPEGDNVQWIPGYWAWDEESQDYLWVSGIWRNIPPGRRWVPGRYHRTTGGWQWVPGFWAVEEQQDLPVLPVPPERIPEAEPPKPREDAVFIPGNWVWVEYRYVWRPGFWCVYRPGWVWVPAHYVWTPCGFVYVEGYWDYPLHCRGLLFAPCRIDRAVVFAPGARFIYTPCYVINDRCLMTALFVQPACGWYYFGDFFDVSWRHRGFVSWVHFRIGRCYDPLFGYYRVHYVHYCRNPIWERDLCGLYEARFVGAAPRPPITLVQQNTIINQVRVNKQVNVTQINNVTMLAPVSKVNDKVVRLEKLDADRLEKERNEAARLAQLARQREKQETLLASKGNGQGKSAEPKRIKLDPPPEIKPAVKEKAPDGDKATDKDKVGEKAQGKANRKATPPPPPVAVKPEEILKQVGSKKNEGEKKVGGDGAKVPNLGDRGIVDRKTNPEKPATDDAKNRIKLPGSDGPQDARKQPDVPKGDKASKDRPSDRIPMPQPGAGSRNDPPPATPKKFDPPTPSGNPNPNRLGNPSPKPDAGPGKGFDAPKGGNPPPTNPLPKPGNNPGSPPKGFDVPKSGGDLGGVKIGGSNPGSPPKVGGNNPGSSPKIGGNPSPSNRGSLPSGGSIRPNPGGSAPKLNPGGSVPKSGGGKSDGKKGK